MSMCIGPQSRLHTPSNHTYTIIRLHPPQIDIYMNLNLAENRSICSKATTNYVHMFKPTTNSVRTLFRDTFDLASDEKLTQNQWNVLIASHKKAQH